MHARKGSPNGSGNRPTTPKQPNPFVTNMHSTSTSPKSSTSQSPASRTGVSHASHTNRPKSSPKPTTLRNGTAPRLSNAFSSPSRTRASPPKPAGTPQKVTAPKPQQVTPMNLYVLLV